MGLRRKVSWRSGCPECLSGDLHARTDKRARRCSLTLRAQGLPLLIALLLPTNIHAAEPPWQEFRTAHFTVITVAGEKKGREITLRFEQMRAEFVELLSRNKPRMPVPLTIFALKDDKRFYQMAPLRNGQPITVPGFFIPGEDHQFIVLN